MIKVNIVRFLSQYYLIDINISLIHFEVVLCEDLLLCNNWFDGIFKAC